MPIDLIEMIWGCLVCSEHVLGRHKNCTNCGAPRKLDLIETSSRASDHGWRQPKKYHPASIPDIPDWKCRYCDSSQYKADGTCTRCGASQTEGTSDPSLPSAKSPRLRSRENIVQIPHPVQDTYRQDASPTILNELDPISLPFWSWNRPGFVRNGCIGAGFVFLLILAYFLFSTREVQAEVISVEWVRTIEIQRYQVNQHEGWSPDSQAISVKNLGKRLHHRERVVVGSHKEPYIDRYACGDDCHMVSGSCYITARSCVSNKNGSATCSGGDRVCSPDQQVCSTRYCTWTLHRTITDYEDRPIYRDWYQWGVWE